MANDWRRLESDDYVGGAVRDRDDRGRVMHRRIARIEMDDFSVRFRFDRVAVLDRGRWRELPLEGNDFLWYPLPLMAIAFDADGTAHPGSPGMPGFIDGIHPRAVLPADGPVFGPSS